MCVCVYVCVCVCVCVCRARVKHTYAFGGFALASESGSRELRWAPGEFMRVSCAGPPRAHARCAGPLARPREMYLARRPGEHIRDVFGPRRALARCAVPWAGRKGGGNVSQSLEFSVLY